MTGKQIIDTAETPAKRGRGRGQPHGQGLSTRERNRALAQSEVKPLKVLMDTMAHRWKLAEAELDPLEKAKLQDAACAVAKDVAPYLHPKLQATTIKGDADAPLSFALNLPDAAVLMAAVRGKPKA